MKASDYIVTNYDNIRIGDRFVFAYPSEENEVYGNPLEVSVTHREDTHFKVLVINTGEELAINSEISDPDNIQLWGNQNPADAEVPTRILAAKEPVREWVEYDGIKKEAHRQNEELKDYVSQYQDASPGHDRYNIAITIERLAKNLATANIALQSYSWGQRGIDLE